MQFTPDPILHLVLLLFCLVCSYTDLKDQVIYDWATVSAFALGIILSLILHGKGAFWSAALGAGLGFSVFGLFWYLKVMASGDVFMMGAVGALVRFPLVLWAMLYASLLGVVVGVIWAAAKGQLRQVGQNIASFFGGRKAEPAGTKETKHRLTPFPYALAIALGSLWAAALAYFPWLGLGVPTGR